MTLAVSPATFVSTPSDARRRPMDVVVAGQYDRAGLESM